MRSRTLFDLLGEMAANQPDRPAVIHAAGTTTYRELYERADIVGRALAASGVVRGDRVVLLAGNRIEWLETYFGAAAAGATVHSINTWVTAAELEDLLKRAACTVLVVQAAFGRHRYVEDLRRVVPEAWEAPSPEGWTSAQLPSLRAIVVLGGDAPPGARAYESWLAAAASGPGDLALVSAVDQAVVLYTSGSTAQPKAVPLLHYGLIENGFNIGERLGLDAADRVWLGSPLFWSYGCANALMSTFTHGATLVLQEQFSAGGAIDLIERERCTAGYLLPTLVHALGSDPGFDRQRVASMRTVLTYGSPSELVQAAETLGVESICNLYGSTEVYGNCCVTSHDEPVEEQMAGGAAPLPGVEIRVASVADGKRLPGGEVGEIQVRGYLTPGYIDVDMVAAGAFTGDGFYRSGDLGYTDDRGWVHFVARASDMIKTSGINVAPAEVEQVLVDFPGVAEAAVVGVPDEVRGELVVAYVVPRDGQQLEEARLIAACKERLASYKVPAIIRVVGELPKTGTGKLSRKVLRQEASATLASGESLPPVAQGRTGAGL